MTSTREMKSLLKLLCRSDKWIENEIGHIEVEANAEMGTSWQQAFK